MTAHAITTSTSAEEAAYDSVLVQRFNKGDEAAFVEIMRRHTEKIFNVALRLVHNRADAEEVTQDTFIRAHRCLAQFRGESSLATWLNRVTTNLARNRYWYFFRRRRHDTLSLDFNLGEYSDATLADLIVVDAADPAQENAHSEFTSLVASCLEKLDPEQREILTLRALRDLPYEDIAKVLHVRLGTVKSRIARARRKLRSLLGEVYPEFASATTGADYFLPSRAEIGEFSLRVAGDH